jgi:hypothetical protein
MGEPAQVPGRTSAGFKLFNRTVNPLVRAILRSPAHPVLSHRLALITVAGRRSGRRITIPVGYRRKGDAVEIRVGWPERKSWWRNLRGTGHQVGLLVRGRELTGPATVEEDAENGVTVHIRIDRDPQPTMATTTAK